MNNIYDNVIYAEEDIPIENWNLIPDTYGVYILKTESGDEYVGYSNNIHNRMYSHIRNKFSNDKIKTISVYVTEIMSDALILEDELIKQIKPKYNTFGKCPNGMTKITIELTNDEDKQLRHLVIEKNVSSKAIYIENVVKEHLKDKENI